MSLPWWVWLLYGVSLGMVWERIDWAAVVRAVGSLARWPR